MKHTTSSATTATATMLAAIATLLLSCAQTPEEPAWDNPWDPEGTSYALPVVAMNDTTVAVRDTVVLHAQGTVTMGTVAGYVWALDGFNYRDTTAEGRLTCSFTAAGLHHIRVRAIDSDGQLSAPDIAVVRVEAYPPRVVAMADTTVAIKDTIAIHASGSDTNGTVVRYVWALDGATYRDTVTTAMIRTMYVSAGVRVVRVKAIDDDGQESAPDVVNLTVEAFPPVVVAMADTVVAINDWFSLYAAGSDVNGQVLRFIWTLEGSAYSHTVPDGLLRTMFSEVGTRMARVTCVDDDGQVSATDTVQIVVGSFPPVVTAMADTEVAINDSIVVHANASDPNGSVARYVWALAAAGYVDTSVTGVLRTVYTTAGARTVRVKAIDDDGQESAPDSVRVTVMAYPPVVVAMDDTTLAINDSVTLHASGTDANGNVVRYVWTLDGSSHVDTSVVGFLRTVYTTAGARTVRVKAIDDDGQESAPDPVRVTVQSYPPSVVAMNDTTVAVNDSFTLHASGSDPNGSVVRYAWAMDGVTYRDSTVTASMRTAYSNAGARTVRVKAIDDDGQESAPDSVRVTVEWYPPSVIAMDDTSVAICDSVALHASGSDPNGTVVRYVWALNGTSYADTSATGVLRTMYTTTGVRTVRVKAIDDDGQESATDSVRVTVQVYPPVLAAIRDTVVSITQATAVVVSSSATDPNGTIQKYYWDTGLNGWDDSTAAASYTVSGSGGSVMVRWAARDDDGVMSEPDTFCVLFNRPPTGGTVTAPTSNTEWVTFSFENGKGTLLLTMTASDPDGADDTATFTLELGSDRGALTQVYTGRTSPYSATGIDSGATVYWRLTLRDLFGDTVSATGTMGAPPPPPAGMKLIPAGTFQLGQVGIAEPVHAVTISSFWMDSTEVTQGCYAALMSATYTGYTSPPWSSYGIGANYPAYYVNWYDAVLYCNARTKERGSVDTVYRYMSISGTPGNDCVLNGLTVDLTRNGFRLPTEAEWEYACRAGTTTRFYWGEATDAATVGTYAWYSSNSGSATHQVAIKQKNAFWLYDMSGNVWEWCNDWDGSYAAGSATDPSGAASGTSRVLRGGSWYENVWHLCSALRDALGPDGGYGYDGCSGIGFRCVSPR